MRALELIVASPRAHPEMAATREQKLEQEVRSRESTFSRGASRRDFKEMLISAWSILCREEILSSHDLRLETALEGLAI